MATHQQTKPRRANQSMTDEAGRSGTVRSKVGCDAIEEPCTKSAAGLPSGVPTYFSHRNRRTAPLCAQCSLPVTALLIIWSKILSKSAGSARDLPLNQLFDSRHRVVILPLRIRRELGFAAHSIQSTFAPVSLITFAQRSFSARKNVPNSAGDEPTISMPAVSM